MYLFSTLWVILQKLRQTSPGLLMTFHPVCHQHSWIQLCLLPLIHIFYMLPQLFWSFIPPFLEFIDQCTVCCRKLLFYLWLKTCHLNGKSSLSCLQLPCLGLGDFGGLLGGLPPPRCSLPPFTY